MTISAFLKPVLAVVVVAALGAGYYRFEHRPHPEEKETQSNALVIVAKSTNACFSDLVRVTGFIVPRREAVVGVDQEGSKVADLLVREGEMVADNQELARLTPPPQQPGARASIDAKRSCGVAVPRTAIDHLTVQVVKGNTVETRKVRVGLVSDTSTEILEGLDEGEIVVADAGSSLHDGDQIKTMFAEDLDRTRVR